jgi:hypothetical protein
MGSLPRAKEMHKNAKAISDKEHKKHQLQIRHWVSGGLQPVFAIDPFFSQTGSIRHHVSVTSPISY